MFNRQDDNGETGLGTSAGSENQTKTTNNTEPSVISAGLTITGNLQSNSDVVIAGTVEGDITSRSLTVSEGAKVREQLSVRRYNFRETWMDRLMPRL